MLNPAKVISALKQRHQFIMNHHELLPFINEFLTNSATEGTTIDIIVREPSGEERNVQMIIQESDMPFFKKVHDIFEQPE